MDSATDIEQPIIQDIKVYSDYPFEAIDAITLALLQRAAFCFPNNGDICRPIVVALECFLQITGQSLRTTILCDVGFKSTCLAFIGALCSQRFFVAHPKLQYKRVYTFHMLLKYAKLELPELAVPQIHISTTGPTEFVRNCIRAFEQLEQDSEKVWLWRAWPSTNRTGRRTWFPLYFVYKRLGRDFTERFHKACYEYFSGRKCHRIPALPELVKYIHQYPEELTPEHLVSSAFVTRFWRDFFVYYMRTGHAAGTEITLLVTNWRNEFLFFIREFLVPSGLFGEPYGSLPSPEPRKKLGHQTHISKTADGIAVKNKLITPVPLQTTDSEAMEILFRQIEEDFNLIKDWATWATVDIWRRYLRRLALAPIGKVRKVFPSGSFIHYAPGETKQSQLNDPKNPEYLQNAAATFAHYGFLSSQESDLISRLFPPPRNQTAIELALPTTGTLLPHCVLLVANHPKITPSFLEKFELYDKHGQRVGLQKTDSGYVLDGRKDRKGPIDGQQVVLLTPETTRIVFQIILLTNPLRKYLRKCSDDSWRNLLLTSQQGFAYPMPIKRLATDTSHTHRLEALAESLGNVSKLPYEARLKYVQRFSLPAVRAQSAVLIYLTERSAAKMSEALGHKKYSPRLLDRYLPQPIRDFFQERWIRIFQTGIIVEALKDSPHLLRASGFDNMEELDNFLLKHVLRTINVSSESPSKSAEDSARRHKVAQKEVIFGLTPEILTAMIGLQLSVRRASGTVSGKAKYWAGITELLLEHLESDLCIRKDLKSYLLEAKSTASPNHFADIIYE